MENEHDKESLSLISNTIMKALMKEFNVPEKDCFQVYHSHKKEEFIYDPNYLLSNDRNTSLLYIQITCGSGRTQQQKQSLYKELANRLHNEIDIPKENIFIVLVEAGLENWSFGDGLAQMIM
ncbi:tautomerase family protein [Terribacillus saccharophilus]|uniref:tautomerase family protein n=1 Tax=Terribacillus saccharophilus TaxID=361277 RepID=UPI00398261FB